MTRRKKRSFKIPNKRAWIRHEAYSVGPYNEEPMVLIRHVNHVDGARVSIRKHRLNGYSGPDENEGIINTSRTRTRANQIATFT